VFLPFITLITYQFSLLPLLVLACLSASLCGLTLAFTLPHTGVDLSTGILCVSYIINQSQPLPKRRGAAPQSDWAKNKK
jgi:hypothetical protein